MNLTLHYIDSLIPHFSELRQSILALLQQEKSILLIAPNLTCQRDLHHFFHPDLNESQRNHLKIWTLSQYWENLYPTQSWGKLSILDQKKIIRLFLKENQKESINSKNLALFHEDYRLAQILSLFEKDFQKKRNLSQIFEDYLLQKFKLPSYRQILMQALQNPQPADDLKPIEAIYFLGFRYPSPDLSSCCESWLQKRTSGEMHCFLPSPDRWMDPEASTAWLYEKLEKIATQKISYNKIDFPEMQLTSFKTRVHELEYLEQKMMGNYDSLFLGPMSLLKEIKFNENSKTAESKNSEEVLHPPYETLFDADFSSVESYDAQDLAYHHKLLRLANFNVEALETASLRSADQIQFFGLNQNYYPRSNLWIENSVSLNSLHQHWKKVDLLQAFYRARNKIDISYSELEISGRLSPISNFIKTLELKPQKLEWSLTRDSTLHPFFQENIQREKIRLKGSTYNQDNGNLFENAFLLQEEITENNSPQPEIARAKFSQALQKRALKTTSLDNFAQCPWSFFAKHILKIQEIEENEGKVSAKLRGILAHRWLEKIFRRFENDFLSQQKIPPLNSAAEIIEACRESLLQEYQEKIQQSKIPAAIFAWELEQLGQEITTLVEAEIDQWNQVEQKLYPRYFEWSFGQGDSPALRIEIDEKIEIPLSGAIDRIDVNANQSEFLVVDYKSSGSSALSQNLRAKRSFQLWIYAQAVQKLLLPQAQTIGGLYWDIKESKKNQGLVLKTVYQKYQGGKLRGNSFMDEEAFHDLQDALQTRLKTMLQKIIRGNFSLQPEDCQGTGCPYRFTCRYENQPNF